MISIFLIRKQQCMQYCPEFDIMLLDMYEMSEKQNIDWRISDGI